jgi:hypothetical protein
MYGQALKILSILLEVNFPKAESLLLLMKDFEVDGLDLEEEMIVNEQDKFKAIRNEIFRQALIKADITSIEFPDIEVSYQSDETECKHWILINKDCIYNYESLMLTKNFLLLKDFIKNLKENEYED